LNYFNEIIRRDPAHSKARLSLAEIHIKLAEYEEALEHLEMAKERLQDNPLYYYLKGNAEEESGDYENSYAFYYRSAHYSDYASTAYQQLAKLDLKNTEFDKALGHIEKSMDQNAENPFLWCMKALAERGKGDYQEALKSAGYALELDPLNGWALNELILANELQGKDVNKLKEEFYHVLIDDPHYYIELSLRYSETGQFDDATRILEIYSEKNPDNIALTSYYLDYFYSLMNMHDEAGKWFGTGKKS